MIRSHILVNEILSLEFCRVHMSEHGFHSFTHLFDRQVFLKLQAVPKGRGFKEVFQRYSHAEKHCKDWISSGDSCVKTVMEEFLFVLTHYDTPYELRLVALEGYKFFSKKLNHKEKLI